MTFDIRSKFTIGECPDALGRWYVDWTKLGPVEQSISKAKLCEIVFDEIRPRWQIGIGYNVQYYKMRFPKPEARDPIKFTEDPKWEVLWISYDAWMSLENHQYEMFADRLFNPNTAVKREVTGIIFETLDQAEQFVNLMEQRFTFYALKREYVN